MSFKRKKATPAELGEASQIAAEVRQQYDAIIMGAEVPPYDELEAQARRRSFEAVASLRIPLSKDLERRQMQLKIARKPQRWTGRRGKRFGVLVASIAAVTSILLLIGVISPNGSTKAAAATPAPLRFSEVSTDMGLTNATSAASQLLELAQAAESTPIPDAGPSWVLMSGEWSLNFAADAADPEAAVIPFDTTTTVYANGSVTRRQQRGAPLTPDGRGVATSFEQLSGGLIQTDQFPAGTVDVELTKTLPRDAQELRSALLQLKGCSQDPRASAQTATLYGDSCLIAAMLDLYNFHTVDNDLQASLWRALATSDQFKFAGAGLDRAGRPCDAIVLDVDLSGETQRWVVMADPHTGQLLGFDHLLLNGSIAGLQAPIVLDFVTRSVARPIQ